MGSARIFGVAAVIAGLAVAFSGGVAAAAGRHPPACAALTFRPVPTGLSDGEQNAGLYKSRFGRIEVMATVKDGRAQNYFVEVNGKPPTAVNGKPPKSVETCARIKRLGPVVNPPANCLGDKLAVLIDHTGEQRYIVLYAHGGSEWHFCSIGGA